MLAVTFTACEERELQSVEETLSEMKKENKQDVNFTIFNDKIKGGKSDAPQNQGSQTVNQSQSKE